MKGLVFDSSPLSHFARADRLEVLEEITSGRQLLVTRAVREEIRQGLNDFPKLNRVLNATCLDEVRAEKPREIEVFAIYTRRLGSSSRHIGEASTLAVAEVRGLIAIIDDRVAVNAGRDRGVEVRGTLRLIANALKKGILKQGEAETLVDQLGQEGGAWFPCSGCEFLAWARRNGLL